MQKSAYVQLSGLTFFQFVVLGAYSPVMSTYLKDSLHFAGWQVGLVMTVYQAFNMLSPLLAAVVVDRLVPSRVLFAALHLVSAVIAVVLASQTTYPAFLLLFGVYAIFLGPTVGLVNALTFARLPPGGTYGAVRLWGTLGWIAAALILAVVWLFPGASLSWMFYLSGVGSVLSAAGAWTLPRVPRSRPSQPFRLVPREAVQVFLRPEILLVGLFYFVSGLLDRFYFLGTAPFLRQLGFSPSQLMPAMTLGQVTEVVLLAVSGRVLARWGFRTTLLAGLVVQVLRFALLVWSPSPLIVLAALSLNGFVFAFFYSTILVFVDNRTSTETRGGVHQLIMLLFAGTSSVVGSFLAGDALDWFARGAGVDFSLYWLVPLGGAVLAFTLVFTLFRRPVP